MVGCGEHGISGWSWFIMFVFIVLVALGILALLRYLQLPGRPNSCRQPVGSNAIDILNERYSKGEISEEEYKKKKAEILK